MKHGQRDKSGATKEIIIRYILAQPTETKEPALRKHLFEKHDRSDASTIKKHLKDLQKMGCMRIQDTNGGSNLLIIDKIGHVYKILEKFPELHPDLRRNNAIAQMLFEKHSGIVKEPAASKYFRIMVKVSPTFFSMCLKHSPETLLKIAENLVESKWIEKINFAEPFYISEVRPCIGNMELNEEQLLALFRASITTDISNGYDCSAVRNPGYIKFEDIDELNFISHLPTVEISVKLLDESKI